LAFEKNLKDDVKGDNMAFYEDPRVTNKEHVQYMFSAHYDKHGGENINVISHWHEMIELQYCVSGNIDVNIGEKIYRLKKGDLCIINSGEVHGWHSDRDCESVIVQIDPQLLFPKSKKVPERKYMYPFTYPDTSNQRVFTKKDFGGFPAEEIIYRIVDECTDMQYGFELSVESDIYRLFLWILRFYKQNNKNADNDNIISNRNYAFEEKMYDYVQNNFHLNITAKDAAKHMNLSYTYFSRIFNDTLGRNFATFVNEVRMRKAEHMLVETNNPVAQIAAQCGFCSTSYFINNFKKKNGVSPLKYRNEFGGKLGLK